MHVLSLTLDGITTQKASTGSSTPKGAYLKSADATVTDGSDVTWSDNGNAIQAVSAAMSGSASTRPSTLQSVQFFDGKLTADEVLGLLARMVPTVTVESSTEITDKVIIVVGWVAFSSGTSPTKAGLASAKSRWGAVRINGPTINTDAGQDDSLFGFSGNLGLKTTTPTNYTWVSNISAVVMQTPLPSREMTDARIITAYPGSTNTWTLDHTQAEQTDDALTGTDDIYTFVGVGRSAVGGSSRTIAVEIDHAAVKRVA